MKSLNNPWIYWPQPNSQASSRLFCFPYAGGGTRIFRSWPQQLPNTVEVGALRLPGRESRINEKPLTQLTSLVKEITVNLLPYLDQPFAFFGHSMGALISFEVARELRRKYGLSPILLLISGHRAPQIPDPDSPIHDLPEPDFIKAISQLNGTPTEVLEDRELMELLIPVLRADFWVLETYTYYGDRPLNCPIIAFGGLDDPEANQAELEGWEKQTCQSFSLTMLPGDHFFIHSAESQLLAILGRSLTEKISTP